MTLLQMATYICNQMELHDATSLARAKVFLDKEYHVLWDKFPWADTQDTATITFSAGTDTVAYPAAIERAITVRATNLTSGSPDGPTYASDSRFIDPVTSTFLIESDPSIFERGGYVQYYEESANIASGVKSLRVYPTPLVDTQLFIVGKAPCPGLTADGDTSRIRNLDNTLIAYAHFDMLWRIRQVGKAKEKLAEAKELEAAAVGLEQQQANQPRRTKAITVAGNSLSEMTDAVCALCGQWAPEYRLVTKEFLRRNYQALYDLFLWPESTLAVRVPYTTEQVVMPPYVDKVLGVRGTTNMRMFPADSVLYLDISPSIFEDIGDPVGFTVLTPVAVSTLPVSAQPLVLASTSTVDVGKVFIRGEVIATGQEATEEITLTGITPVTTANTYDIPLTVAKDITVGDVTVNSAGDSINLAIIPAGMRELKHQRLWFLPVPNTSNLGSGETFTCLVLAKRVNRPLITDQDTPIITGAQQALIAASAGDMFRKLGKAEDAQAMMQKAAGAIEALKAKNMDQAASSPRFVPGIEPRAYSSASCCAW